MKLLLRALLVLFATSPFTSARIGLAIKPKLEEKRQLASNCLSPAANRGILAAASKARLGLSNEGKRTLEGRRPVLPHEKGATTTLSQALLGSAATPSSPATNKIINGEPAETDEFPWFASWDYTCGATLIHEDLILTSWFCAGLNTFTSDIYINANRNPFGSRNLLETEQRSAVIGRLYPWFDPFFDFESDIMIVKLDAPSTLPTVTINSDPSEPTVRENVTMIGHGVTDLTTFEVAPVLQKVSVPVVSQAECQSAYDEFGISIEDIMLCAGELGRGACFGDDGGPVLQERDGEMVQVGIVSFGVDCATEEPIVNTRISSFESWIRDETCRLSDNPPGDCPTSVPDDAIPIRMDILLDDFPREASWVISRDGEPLLQTQGLEPGLISDRILLTPGEYTFTIRDLAEDGICCDYGEGNYTIVAEYASGDVVLATSDGDYGSGETQMFAVPDDRNPPTSPPSGNATCSDTNATFLIDADIGEGNCTFLEDNMDRFDYLCSFFDVALACPATCDVCEALNGHCSSTRTEPTDPATDPPEPTDPETDPPEPEESWVANLCLELDDGTIACLQEQRPTPAMMTIYFDCPSIDGENVLECQSCAVVDEESLMDLDENDVLCDGCIICTDNISYDCTNLDYDDICLQANCAGECTV